MDSIILGPVSQACMKLEQAIVKTVVKLGIDAHIMHNMDESEQRKYEELEPPILLINNQVVCSGHVPDQTEIESLLQEHVE